MIYSYSLLATYRQCPQKFKFIYIDRIPSPTEGIESFMGSRVHEALEKLYLNLRHAKPMTPSELLAYYDRLWDEKWHDGVQVVREEMAPDEYRALGVQCLERYDRHYRPFDQSHTLGLEYPVKFSLDMEGRYTMRGYIDRLSQPKEGVVWIHDYKTRGFFPTQQEIDTDTQLAYYQMAVMRLWPQTEQIVLIWHYLIYDYEFRSVRNAETLEALRVETIALIQEIESTTVYPTHQSPLCKWCDYQRICPLFRHQYETAALAEPAYHAEEGVVLVERLGHLLEAEAQNKREIEQVKNALGDYAEKKGVESLYSRRYQVRVRRYASLKFPWKNEPASAALVTLLKAEDKWNEVSMLDGFALDKIVQNKTWEPPLLEKVRAFGQPAPTVWVKLSPRSHAKKEEAKIHE